MLSLPLQKSEVIKSIWVVPIFGSYRSVECPTYITDEIYFNGTTDLIGGSNKPLENKIIIKTCDPILLSNFDSPEIDGRFSRHVPFECNITFTREGLDNLVVTYNTPKKNVLYSTYTIQSDRTECHSEPTDKIIGGEKMSLTVTQSEWVLKNAVIQAETEEDFSMKRLYIIEGSHYTQQYSETLNSFITISDDDPTDVLHTTRKPHVLFIKNGNLHTIQEEKLSLPILGLLGIPSVFLIRYYDVQLADYKLILWKNPFGLANVIGAVNGLFLLCVAYIVIPHIYKNF